MTKGTSITRMIEQHVQKLLALDKDKRAFWYFEPEHAMGNHNWVQYNHRFSAICFLRSFTDFFSCNSILTQLPSSFSLSASRNITFPFHMFPASLRLITFLVFNSSSQGYPLSPLLHEEYFFFLELHSLKSLGFNCEVFIVLCHVL